MSKEELIEMLNYLGKLGRRFPTMPEDIELYEMFYGKSPVEMPEELNDPQPIIDRINKRN